MQLDTTTKSLEFLLGGTVTTNHLPYVVSFLDIPTVTPVLESGDGVDNGATAVTVVAAPASNVCRKIQYLNIYNQDTVSQTVTVQLNDNGTKRIFSKTTLAVGSTLMWTGAEGFFVLDTNGNRLVPTSSGDGNQNAWNFKYNANNSSAAPTYQIIGAVSQQSGAGYSVVNGDFAKLIAVTNASAQTLTLPGTPPAAGWYISVENIGTGTWTISRNGLNIDGGTTNPTISTNQGCVIFSDGSNYFTNRGIGGGAKVKTGSFTRDMTLASGSQSITGVGFKPQVVIFVGGVASTSQSTIGFDDASTHASNYYDLVNAAETADFTDSINVDTSAANYYSGHLSSLDSDGFTISWTKVNSPTGTMTVKYLAIA